MRDIHLARVDKTRPVVVLTRELARDALSNVTVAPITSTVKGIGTEVRVGSRGAPPECRRVDIVGWRSPGLWGRSPQPLQQR
ncbi:type II toxin-antitoxin system PemK/MazF family toxin [Nocardioides humi]|uniref:type II toxin-antitoxin system PemK/MazF family toxin n=1 Tax=Nocardioides humi TaxID=449461 RepID=UPI00112EE39E|nr:type II toxin-antitoxin system PemK/MazF family toxin [Nocardioides humi]